MSKEAAIYTGLAIAGGLFFFGRIFGRDTFAELRRSVNRSELTYPPEMYEVFANDLQVSFWGGFFGLIEDEQAVIDTLALLENDADFAYLVAVYGMRSDAEVNNLPGFFGGLYAKQSLISSVQDYLNSAERQEINAHFESVGINFRFNV